jgi:hypothetical protein
VTTRLLAAALAFFSAAALAQGGAALRAKHAELRDALEASAFQSPVYLASREEPHSISGDAYAIIRKPFPEAVAALEKPAAWCDIMFLHLNTKYCNARGGTLDVAIGKKHDQPLADTFRMKLGFTVAERSPEYLRATMTAPEGPLGTRDYRIGFEAVPLDESRSFVHLSYAYAYGLPSRLAAQAYLSTAGASKVGFTVTGRQPDGRPRYVGGMRGVVERNTMRYYLAIEAYLGALGAPREQRLEKSLRDWFAGTERFPRQLREVGQSEYLDMKRREYARQS